MDAVYLIGKGSKADNWELRMSLRSIAKHWKKPDGSIGPDRIWIIGENPGFLNLDDPLLRWLPAKDPHGVSKDSNLIQKLLLLCLQPDAPEKFVFFSDDQGILRDCSDVDFRAFHSGETPGRNQADNEWLKRLKGTANYLRRHGFPGLHFDTHVPQPMETRELSRFLDTDFGFSKYTICTLYFNLCRTAGVKIDETNIRAGLYGSQTRPAEIRRKTETLGNLFYSIDEDSTYNFWLVRELERLFPDPAPWELNRHVLSEAENHFPSGAFEVTDMEVMRELLES